MKKLLFGTAGIPLSTPLPNTTNGIKQVKKLGLDSMELEFVRSVHISQEKAPEIKSLAKDKGVTLTCHGQYYINLNAQEEKKIEASKKRIILAASRASQCGAYSMTFHAAYYMKQNPEKVYQKVKQGFQEVVKELQNNNHSIWVRPETTGKITQWGNLKETVKLAEEVEQVLPCIDFSHLHARSNGKFNTKEEFKEMLNLVERKLGRKALDNMHIHLTGINYGERGEKHHLTLNESDMNWQELLQTWKEFKIKGVVTCESPNIEKDALMMKKYFKSI